MSIKTKLVVVVTFITFTIITVVYLISYSTTINGFLEVEKDDIIDRLNQINNTMNLKLEEFSKRMNDWAIWDETYEFMNKFNQQYIISNVTYESMHSLDLDFFLFLSNSNEVLLTGKFDHKNQKILNLDKVEQKLIIDTITKNNLINSDQTYDVALCKIKDIPTAIGINIILKSNGSGPKNGLIVFGKTIDERSVLKLNKSLGMNFNIVNPIFINENFSELKNNFPNNKFRIKYLNVFSDDKISSFLTLICNDLNMPILTLNFSTFRSIYQKAKNTFNTFVRFLLIFGIIILVFTSYCIDKFIIKNIEKLTYAIKNIDIKKIETLNTNIKIKTNDEIGFLTLSINNMLKNIYESHQKLNQLTNELQLALEAKNNFIANIGHELRTPITCIIGYTELLNDYILDNEALEYLNKIKLSAHTLSLTINDIIDYINLKDNQLLLNEDIFNFKDLVSDIINCASFIASEKKLEFKYQIDEKLFNINLIGDSVRLKQVLLNLVGNAIKFTKEGKVELNVKILNENLNDIEVNISVLDTGIGILKEKQKEIFLPFVQADNSISRLFGGTGLGLTIANEIVKLMNNKGIELESEINKGSKFYFNVKFKKVA